MIGANVARTFLTGEVKQQLTVQIEQKCKEAGTLFASLRNPLVRELTGIYAKAWFRQQLPAKTKQAAENLTHEQFLPIISRLQGSCH